jgi:glycosyltransferase involved in cell wall biosynthesis
VAYRVKVLIVTFDPTSGSGGVEGRTMAYTKSLLRRAVQVEVAALEKSRREYEEDYMGTRLFHVSSSIRRLPRTLGVLATVMAGSSVDSVFLLSGGSTPAGVLLLGYCFLTRKRSAVFYYGKDILQARRWPFNRVALDLSLVLAGGVGANSRFTAGLLPFRPRGRLTIIYPGVDPAMADGAATQAGRSRSPTILFVGRLVRRKGVDLLIQAVQELRRGVPNIALEIVGDGPEAGNLRALVDRLGLGDSVTFHGALYGAALVRKYAEASMLVMPSRDSPYDTEGFGTVFLEAGAFGVPSIGTRIGGIPEAIIDGKTGKLVESENVEELVQAIQSLLDNPTQLEQMGENARKRAAQLSWDTSTDMLLHTLGQDPA